MIEVEGYFHGLEVCGTVTKDQDGSGQPLYEVDDFHTHSGNGEEVSDLLKNSTHEKIKEFLIDIAISHGL